MPFQTVLIVRKRVAALLGSAAFLFSIPCFAAAPIIDAGSQTGQPSYGAPAPGPVPMDAGIQSELLNQLQRLQDEVMQLRGLAEEQANEIRQLKTQSMERYVELDRRIVELMKQPGTGAAASAGSAQSSASPVAGGKLAPAPAALPGEKEAYDKAYQLVTAQRFDSALEAFRQFLVDYPKGAYAANGYYWLGELNLAVQPPELESSRDAFLHMLNQYPNSPKAPDAMYKLGKAYFLLGDKVKSREWLDKVIANHSGGAGSAADKAKQFISENF